MVGGEGALVGLEYKRMATASLGAHPRAATLSDRDVRWFGTPVLDSVFRPGPGLARTIHRERWA